MEICEFKIAQKLKEKGFNQKPKHLCLNSYYEYDGLRKITPLYNENIWYDSENKEYLYYAPTISQVLKWLRETHNIYIVVFIDDDTDKPVTFEIYKGTECVMCEHSYYSLAEWNKAEMDAIEYVIDNLI